MKYYSITNATIPVILPSAQIVFTPTERFAGVLRGVHSTSDTQQQLEIADVAAIYGIKEVTLQRFNELVSKRGAMQSSLMYDPAGTRPPLSGSVTIAQEPIAKEADEPKALPSAEEETQQLEDLTQVEVAEDQQEVDEGVVEEGVVEYVSTYAQLAPLLNISEDDLKSYSRKKDAPRKTIRGHSVEDWKNFLAEDVDEQEAEEAELSDVE
jgi:hypothetical protein